ncbi:hypothetical protein L2E82_51600 [Cichorium intybus]|nr:hypothetical protein L1887_04081 [Cichorium endivia]KAI3679226.1 hypothetical protein L2E82_51600 [Cichorium intybus]
MADIRDEHGRPIQLTDELGRPVQLTDEHGAPIHLTGVASTQGHTTIGSELRHKTTHDQTTDATMGSETHGGTHFAPTPVDYVKRGADAVVGAGAATVGVAAGAAKGAVAGAAAPLSHTQAHGAGGDKKELERSTSSSSSSSEDDGQGGRRKKKGLMQKIKEKLPGRNEKEKEKQATAHSTDTKVTGAGGVPAGTRVEYHEQEHEKKGFMDKIKDKLPGHH